MNKKYNLLAGVFVTAMFAVLLGLASCGTDGQSDQSGDAHDTEASGQVADTHEGHDHAEATHDDDAEATHADGEDLSCADACAAAAKADEHDDDHGAEPEADEHAGHGHGEGSDLDRNVDELFAAGCEHGVPTHQCDECRYEVGVVLVPKDLIEQRLVEVETVGNHGFGIEEKLTGEIQFDERKIAHLGPRLPGIIRRVLVDLGQTVSAGEPLIEIDSGELAEAQAAYLGALTDHQLAKRSFDRQRELREAKITSEREYLEAEQASKTAEIRANSARQKLLRLGIADSEIAALENAGIAGATGRQFLKAPFAGEVLEMHAVRGERVDVDRQLVLFGDTRTLWVWVDLYEAHLGAVALVQPENRLPAFVSVRAYPDDVFQGHLDFVGRTMDETTRTIKARITLENRDGKLRPGMFASVRIAVGNQDQKLAVPQTAVISDEGRDFVFVHHQDDYFVRRPVERGQSTDEFVEICSGLEAGQSIAVAGAFLLKSDVLRAKMGEGCAH